ncbi:hypothetical protein SSYM_1912, partial [Serratia symbiotica str. Tucson]
RDISLNWLHNQ